MTAKATLLFLYLTTKWYIPYGIALSLLFSIINRNRGIGGVCQVFTRDLDDIMSCSMRNRLFSVILDSEE